MVEKRPLQTLEQRITACLRNNGDGVKTSAAVSDLIQEVNAAIAVAEASVKAAKQAALDPSLPYDEDAVQRLARDEIKLQRLHLAGRPVADVQKIIKDAGGNYIAGGFNKAKLDHGGPAVGNRYVIIRFENEAGYDKFWSGGGKQWIDKNAPEARQLKVEGVEQK